MLHRASELLGAHLDARDGTLGKIKDLLFDDESWIVRYLVADTGSWLASRRVLLSPFSARAGAWEPGKLPVDLTRRQVERSPALEETRPLSAQYQQDLHAYYGWPAYWGSTMGPALMAEVPRVPSRPTAPPGAPSSDASASRLRGMEQVRGYAIQASDGELGHVEDFLVADSDWRIPMLVVDTRNWLPGKRVLVPAESVDRVSWGDSAVAVGLTREFIKNSPEYRDQQPLPPEYEQSLGAYYRSGATGR